MEYFATYQFSKQKYNEIRDVYVAMSFLAYAYADIHSAEPDDTFIGMDKNNRYIPGPKKYPNYRKVFAI